MWFAPFKQCFLTTPADYLRWNVYHYLASSNTDKHHALLEHVFSKLPEDVTAHLLLQQSKGALNTVRMNCIFDAMLHLISRIP